MSRVKQFIKYIIWVVLVYVFSSLMIFIGLNVNYKPIQNNSELPEEITISKAEATGVNGRIYGQITNSDEFNLNGQYIEIDIYNEDVDLIATKYIEIVDVGSTKNFELHFKSNEIKYYDIYIVPEKPENTEGLFDNIFISEDMKERAILGALIYMFFIA